MIVLKFIIHSVLVLLLTIVTQLGGVAYVAAISFPRFRKRRRLAFFILSYFGLWLAASFMAPFFGRAPLSCGFGDTPHLKMQSPLYCVLNRQYVTPELKRVAADLAKHVESQHPDTVTLALDGNFPFFEGFPLLPHLSHDDGRKLDIAFYYSKNGKTKSPIGYWAFEAPRPDEFQPCKKSSAPSLRWNVPWFRITHNSLTFDESRTKTALKWLQTKGRQRGVSKVFVEPHLKHRLKLTGENIRFQGCRAARHDDHIHFQIK